MSSITAGSPIDDEEAGILRRGLSGHVCHDHVAHTEVRQRAGIPADVDAVRAAADRLYVFEIPALLIEQLESGRRAAGVDDRPRPVAVAAHADGSPRSTRALGPQSAGAARSAAEQYGITGNERDCGWFLERLPGSRGGGTVGTI
jgi:hypothetical protein